MRSVRRQALVFMHIPKTGGTSLHEILVRHFREADICPEQFNRLRTWTPEELQKYALFSGHFDRDGIAHIPQPKDIITIFREPKSRILSLYHFWKSHKPDVIERGNLVGPRVAKSLPVLGFLRHRDDAVPANIDNIITRTLLGRIFVGKNGEYFCPKDEVLDRAVEYIDGMAAFGVMEEFEDSVRHLLARLGLRDPGRVPHARDSRSLTDPALEPIEAEPITPEVEAELERLTEMDQKVYAYAVGRFALIREAEQAARERQPDCVAGPEASTEGYVRSIRESDMSQWGATELHFEGGDLQAQADGLRWFHSIELGNGVVTKGMKSLKLLKQQAGVIFSPGIQGKSVLDIGAWDGAFSFEAEHLGARDVLATDHYSWIGSGWGKKAAFDLAKRALRSSVRELIIDVLDISEDKVGAFDIVLFLGVFYHLKHPFLALERIAPIAKELLVLDTDTSLDTTEFPVMRFFPGAEWAQDASNWWVPNIPCVKAMLAHVGFRRIEVAPNPSYDVPLNEKRGRFIFHAWRGDHG